MTDILLIQAPNIRNAPFDLPGTEVPLSLLYLSGFLKSRGHSVQVLDLGLAGDPKSALGRALYQTPPKIVGISSYTPNVGVAARIAGRVKRRRPDALLVLGGFHASALPEATLGEFPVFDLLVHGEGEETLAELLSTEPRCDLEKIKGLAYRENGKVRVTPPRDLIADLDGLPFPDRDAVPVTRYRPGPGNYASLPSTGILYSRGCPAPCTFCSKSVFGDTIRYRSVENFLAEIRECQEKYGIHDFRFFDEGPTIRRRNMLELCEEILRQELRFTWNCFSRVDVADEELLRLMSRAGCYHVIYGIESAVPETQKRIKKKVGLERAREICRLTRRLGMECKVNFILAFPWEGEEEVETNIRFALDLEADFVTFNLFKPLPGSPLFREMSRAGLLRTQSWEDYFTTSDAQVFEGSIPRDKLKKILKMAWMRFYFRPATIRRRLAILRRAPLRETKTALLGLWFLLRNLA